MKNLFPVRALRAVATLALLCVGAGALAEEACPTRTDLADGIRLTRTDPFLTSLYHVDDTGLWELRSFSAGETGPRSFYPHPLAVGMRDGDGPTLAVAYAGDPADLDRLDMLQTWGSDITLLRDGEAIEEGYFEVTLLGIEQISVGGCTYTAWNTRDILVLGGGEPILFEKFYAPDLGLVLRTARIDQDGVGISTVIMDRIEFENR